MAHDLHAAVDLGAGSGRVLIGAISSRVTLREVHRFTYAPRHSEGHLRWDTTRLFDGLRTGLRDAAIAARAEGGELRTVGVDAWGVDYGLVDETGELVEEPVCYRDARTGGMIERALSIVPKQEIFSATGIQFMPINTLFQLMAHVDEGLPRRARRLLMIPDICHQLLCGSTTGELTNASTTQMLRVDTGDWDEGIFSRLNLPRHLMPPLTSPGTTLAPVRDDLRQLLDLPAMTVITPATHDTGSAVAGTPLEEGWAFISSGTWSLVGVVRNTALVTDRVMEANFTNERGVAGTFRFLKNVAGLWLLECCRNEWQESGADADIGKLIAAAAAVQHHAGFVYPDAARFFNPPSMVKELRSALRETGQVDRTAGAELTRVVLDSLALRYASVINTIEALTGRRIPGIHIVGGGSLNDYLNQATANATGRPVVAGPVEATGLGNLVMQTVAGGRLTLAEAQQRIRETFAPRRYEPRDAKAWEAARTRYKEIEDDQTRH